MNVMIHLKIGMSPSRKNGCILIVIGLFTESPRIKGFEIVRLLIGHHPPWLRDPCLSFKLFNKKINLRARCTG